MADTDTTTAPDPNQLIQQLAQQLGSMGQVPQADTTPVNRSFASLLGEAVGGGDPTGMMSPAQHEAAGTRALLNFGANMLAASGYHPVRTTLGEAFAQGLQGAGQSEAGSAEAAYNVLGQRQQLAMKQQEMRLSALKEAIPLLRLQMGAGIPNTLLGGANTSIGAVGQQAPTFEGAIAGREGTAPNPNSSAAGVGQFLVPTWNAFAKANPQLFQGMNQDQILAARNNPQIAQQAITWLAQQNASTLTAAGVTPSGQSLGISHYVGAGPAAKIMGAPDTDPVSKYVGGDAVKANPELGTMTVGQMKQRYAAMPAPGFLNTKAPPAPAQAATGPAQPPRVQVASLTPQVPQPPATPAQPPPPAPTTTTGGLTPPAVTPPAAAPTPDTRPDSDLTFSEFRAKHAWQPTPDEQSRWAVTPDPAALAAAQSAKQQAAIQLQAANRGLGGDPDKALQAFNTASDNVDKLQQQAQIETVKNRQDWYAKQDQILQQNYQAAKQQAAQVALETQKGQIAQKQAEITAGYTVQQKQRESDMEEGKTFLQQADQQASSANDMRNLLALIGPNVKSLPSGMVAQVLSDHPDLVNYLRGTGVITGEQADATQLIRGLTQYASTMMRPKGTGALRTPEMTAFQAVMPTLLESPEGRQKALAFLQAYNDRIVQEADFAHSYFKRQVPSTEPGAAPGTQGPAYNIDGLWGAAAKPTAQGGLGDVVPHYHGDMNDGNAYQTWLQSQPSGRPYWGYKKGADGKLVETLQVAP